MILQRGIIVNWYFFIPNIAPYQWTLALPCFKSKLSNQSNFLGLFVDISGVKISETHPTFLHWKRAKKQGDQTVHLFCINYTLVHKVYTCTKTVHLNINCTLVLKLYTCTQTVHLYIKCNLVHKLYTCTQTVHFFCINSWKIPIV